MSADLSSGLPWVIIDIVGVAILGLVAIYGIVMWNRRRVKTPPGPAHAPGPATKSDERRAA
jgi:uncharacterized iron-regulated membrane protein